MTGITPLPLVDHDKAHIRAQVIEVRNRLPAALRQQYSHTILEKIVALESFRNAAAVMGYCGFGSEIETEDFIETTLECGKTLVLPKVNRSAMRLETYVVKNPQTDLMPGVWGIREPNPQRCLTAGPGELDFILVPGVAFDHNGGRIGYGKGFYDQLLKTCAEHGGFPWTVAAAFDIQLVGSVPMESHDVFMDAVITERRSILLRN